jgi:hypothetical protein
MTTLKLIGVYSLAFLSTFAWIWRISFELKTGRRLRALWPPGDFSPHYIALVLQRLAICTVGILIAVASILLFIFVLVPRL